MSSRKHSRRASKKPSRGPVLGELLRRHPGILEVLYEHGVHFCPGCYLTLFSSPERAAAYHAVRDKKAFLSDLRRRSR